MRIKEIELVFENCEVITIPGKYIGRFYVGNIRKSLSRIAVNSTRMFETARKIVIEIHKDAEVPNRPFGTEDENDNSTFDRILKCNDITDIEITLEDAYGKEKEEHYVFYTDWIGDSEYKNEGQKSKRSELGHLYILITRKNKKEGYFDKVFPPEEINDKEYMDFHFKMLNIGNMKIEELADANG